MDPDLETICASLAHRPAVLLLGQAYLGTNGATNPFFECIAQRFGDSPDAGLQHLISHLEEENAEGSLRWLHRRSSMIPISDSLDTISSFPWSTLFTSAIDEVWARAFKKNWRSINAVFSDHSWPLENRDRNRLTSSFLFGCVDKEDQQSKVPADEFQLIERNQMAVSLLRRLPEFVTPLGTVIISGYNPDTDWLKPQDLYPVLNALGPRQIAFFSPTQSSVLNKHLERLHKSGKLIWIHQPLADFLKQGMAAGKLPAGDPASKLPAGRQITIDSKPNVIPKDLWINLSGIAIPVDDNCQIPPPPLEQDLQYAAFRSFLADPVKLNDWTPYARGFAFERDFFHELESECRKRLSQTQLQRLPLIVDGESGTGKTVTLANLAFRIASRAEHPVLYIERSASSVDWRPIDRYLNWVEDCGAASSLVVWDGMRNEHQYLDLLNKLSDRGRKVVLVGSSYPNSIKKAAPIEAPRQLNANEFSRFLSYLRRFDPVLAEQVQSGKFQVDATFLVALYRLLPAARPQLTKGIAAEVEHAQRETFDKISNTPPPPSEKTTLEAAFAAVGWPESLEVEKRDEHAYVLGEQLSDMQELFALVMVPGKYGFKVPIELVVAALGNNLNSTILQALQTTVLVWEERSGGEILVGPRHPLEARLYIDYQFGSAPEAEALFIQKLLHGIRQGAVGEPHIDFAVDLLRLVGPNSPVSRYKSHFANCVISFAESLTSLREDKGVVSSRLMLQEASFYREGVGHSRCELPNEVRWTHLQRAESVLLSARERNDCPQHLRSVISSELAACYGSMIHLLEDNGTDSVQVLGLYERAHSALNEAVRHEVSNAHVVVTLGWISRQTLLSESLTSQQRGEIIAELLYRFDEAVPSTMEPLQQEYFFKERHKVMEQIGNAKLAEEAFQQLKKIGSKAGYYLRARSLIDQLPDDQVSNAAISELESSEKYLRDHWKEISDDERCLGLYFRVWWLRRVREPLFFRERKVLPFSTFDWAELSEILGRLKDTKGLDVPAWLRFLSAMASFHIGDVPKALAEFKDIASDPNLSVGGNRLRKYFVASIESRPTSFDGTIRGRVQDREIGQVWVNDLRSVIPVIPRDFDARELRSGQSLNEFHIAFSYTGPIAQPPHFLRSRA